jgi:hypothetical protein
LWEADLQRVPLPGELIVAVESSPDTN